MHGCQIETRCPILQAKYPNLQVAPTWTLSTKWNTHATPMVHASCRATMLSTLIVNCFRTCWFENAIAVSAAATPLSISGAPPATRTAEAFSCSLYAPNSRNQLSLTYYVELQSTFSIKYGTLLFPSCPYQCNPAEELGSCNPAEELGSMALVGAFVVELTCSLDRAGGLEELVDSLEELLVDSLEELLDSLQGLAGSPEELADNFGEVDSLGCRLER
jgi:hypothetical protein